MVHPKLLSNVKSLVAEGLKAGGYLKGEGRWESYHGGERLLMRDTKIGAERQGAVIIAEKLTASLLMAAALGDLRNYVVIGGQLAPDVDLGKVRAERLRRAAKMGENYWAVYVVEGAVLVSLGAPFSSSRLVGEILHAQANHAFEQRRVCAECGALNPYRASHCKRCGAKLVATGRLNRWMRYDDEETHARELTPEEQKKLLDSAKPKALTMLHPWKADTVSRKTEDRKPTVRDRLTGTTIRSKKPSAATSQPAPQKRPRKPHVAPQKGEQPTSKEAVPEKPEPRPQEAAPRKPQELEKKKTSSPHKVSAPPTVKLPVPKSKTPPAVEENQKPASPRPPS